MKRLLASCVVAAICFAVPALADDAAQPVPAPVPGAPGVQAPAISPTQGPGAFLIIKGEHDISVALPSSAACEGEVVRIAKVYKAVCVHLDGK